MPKYADMGHSALIISASEEFDVIAKKALSNFAAVESRKSGMLSRRSLLERSFDIVIINAPLPDETGEALALDIAERSNVSVLLVVPVQVYEDALERVTDYGVLVISKPLERGRVDKAVRLLAVQQRRLKEMEKKILDAQQKLEELRMTSRAKLLLVEKKHMSEDEAHRFIGKKAMDNGLSRGAVARRIIDDLE